MFELETCGLKIPVAYRVIFNAPKSLHCDLIGSPFRAQKPTPCRNLDSQDFDGNFRVIQDGLRRTLSVLVLLPTVFGIFLFVESSNSFCLMSPPKRPYRKYTSVDMEHAIQAVKNGTSVASASKQFGIPRITLLYKVKGKYEVNCRIGPSTVLTTTEEEHLVKWLLTISDHGFPATRLQLLDSVQIIMKKLKRPNTFVNDRPGRKWFHSFLKRHPQISEKLTQNLTKARSDLNEVKLRGWFNEVENYVKSKKLENVFTDPRRIFNVDETAFFLAPKGMKCLMRKGDRTSYNFICNDDKECLTCLVGANASGMILPPMIMFCYERIPPHISNLMPKGWAIGKSESGWMTGQTFYEFVSNIFYPWIISNNIPLPVILFVDGHTSHLTMELSSFCLEHDIELIALYPNATHILQPMDVAVFHPLKNGWKKSVQQYKMDNDGQKLKREYFAPLLKIVIEENVSPETIQNGFKTCGLCPLDANAVPYQRFFKNVLEEESSDKPRLEYTQRDLDFIEKEIGIAKLRKFKECHNKEMWHGDIEDTSLYNLWKKIYEEIHNKNEMLEKSIVVSETENTATLDIQDTQHSDLIELEENTIENQSLEMIINITPPNNAEKKIEKENITPITPAKKITVLSNTLLNPPNKETLENNTIIDPSIPSPFKSCLFWPKPKPSKPNKRSREKIPTVATSDQWREYHKRKQEAKAKTEKEKEERKRKREENRILREESKKKKNKQLKATCDDSSDSSIDMVLESEGEGDDWAEISESEDGAELNNNGFKLNDYVIVKYDGHYYPGQIKDIHDEQYHISAMLPSGSDWKWPVLEDIMWYQKDDVIMTIGIPIAKNKRGAMTVPEMEQYLLNFMDTIGKGTS
ncbi:hypothetical protein NQ318_014254 [Aromia moschata]|uniref:Transposase n=1 Tax=Aromia moschata TaxID=1265417 RepID=A0AAV8YYJ0_9CUCU|nr:hypothetical protein NQ318_014254 [Aromia moschata]